MNQKLRNTKNKGTLISQSSLFCLLVLKFWLISVTSGESIYSRPRFVVTIMKCMKNTDLLIRLMLAILH